jgi:hypothetical protein
VANHQGTPPRAHGIVAAARSAALHARRLVRLERELARLELERKGQSIGAGVALAIAAAILALFAIGFGLAAATAALALVVAWWLALLIVFLLLALLVVGLAFASSSLVRSATPLKPETAIEEARLTKQVLRRTRAE